MMLFLKLKRGEWVLSSNLRKVKEIFPCHNPNFTSFGRIPNLQEILPSLVTRINALQCRCRGRKPKS